MCRPLSASAAILLLLLSTATARAGAWTLPEGHVQIIAGASYSEAGAAYGAGSRPNVPVRYEKVLAQLHVEYGWNDWLTLIAAPDYAAATLVAPRRPPDIAHDIAFEGGARARLSQRWGQFSLQLTAKTAGAYDTSVSVNGAPGQQLELRALYGTGFSVFGRDGFFDAEIAQRWIAGRRADELAFDLTAGLRIDSRTQLLLQSFSVIAEDNARFPYSYFRLHKLSMSSVTRLWRGVSLESGAFAVPAGQNALAEQGFMLKLWLDF